MAFYSIWFRASDTPHRISSGGLGCSVYEMISVTIVDERFESLNYQLEQIYSELYLRWICEWE